MDSGASNNDLWLDYSLEFLTPPWQWIYQKYGEKNGGTKRK